MTSSATSQLWSCGSNWVESYGLLSHSKVYFYFGHYIRATSERAEGTLNESYKFFMPCLLWWSWISSFTSAAVRVLSLCWMDGHFPPNLRDSHKEILSASISAAKRSSGHFVKISGEHQHDMSLRFQSVKCIWLKVRSCDNKKNQNVWFTFVWKLTSVLLTWCSFCLCPWCLFDLH